MIYDVIIIGAGPSGGILAYELSKVGLNTLIIEKDRLPRHKSCAGGVTIKVLNLLDFGIDDVVEDRLFGYISYLRNRDIFTKRFNSPMFNTVLRESFDYLIVKKALSKGAKLIDNNRVKRVELNNGNSTVVTDNGIFSGRIIVGADGVYSSVAKSIGLMKNREYGIAIDGEVYPKDMKILDIYKERFCLDFDCLPKGYGWIFPKRDRLSTGVFSIKPYYPGIKGYFYKFIESKGISVEDSYIKIKGHHIPLGGVNNKLHQENALLVGDAAGLADPLTGEGIYYAIKSSIYARDVIVDSFKNNNYDFSYYTNRINRDLTKNFKYARKISFLFYNFPNFTYKLFKRRIGVNTFFGICRGSISYKDFYKSIYKEFNNG
jgi:geranylgeranyl reductase family protein